MEVSFFEILADFFSDFFEESCVFGISLMLEGLCLSNAIPFQDLFRFVGEGVVGRKDLSAVSASDQLEHEVSARVLSQEFRDVVHF